MGLLLRWRLPQHLLCDDHSHNAQGHIVVLQFEQVDPAIARDLKELEAGLAARGFSLIWYVGLHTTSGHTHPSANLTPAVIVSFVDETDPAVAAFLRLFNVPILSLVSNETSRQAVGRAQVTYLVQHGQHRIVFAAPERPDVQRRTPGGGASRLRRIRA